MLLRRFVACTCSVGILIFGTGGVFAQKYPNKPIRIVTAPAGSANDIASRLIGQGLMENLGQRVIVDNRPGFLGIEVAAKASSDGYTLLLFGGGVWLSQFFNSQVAWDPERDFAPLTLVITSPNVIAVHPSVPVKSVEELIALAKAKPGHLNYASGPQGVGPHLAAELFKYMTGTDIVRVSYKGTGPSVAALIAGEVQVMFVAAGSVMGYVKSGRLRALAVASSRQSELAPGIPSLETSVPGYESAVMIGMWAPARTNAAIIKFLHREIVRVLNRPDIKERFFEMGTEVVASSPEEYAAAIRNDTAKWKKVIAAAGIRPE